MSALDQTRAAVFASENLMAITGPCGHAVPFEDAFEAIDRYHCPTCGMRYRIEQEPPEVYPSGFVMPGDRKLVIDECRSQRDLEAMTDNQKPI